MGIIHIVGLGPGSMNHLTLEVYRIMKEESVVYVRTMKHPIIKDLLDEGICVEGFDWLYEKSDTFEDVYSEIASILIDKAKFHKKIVFAVPGHPLFAEKTVEILLEILDNKQDEVKIQIHSSMSFLDVVITSLKIDPINGLKIVNALTIDDQGPDPRIGNIVTQVYDRFVASEVKLSLLEHYDGEKEIILLSGSGIPNKEKCEKIPLYQLDRIDWIDYLTTIYIPPEKEERLDEIDALVAIMERLRSDNGCPWDLEQSHNTLKRYLIEEVYEVIDAIDNEDFDNLVEELGDLLLQIVFHCQIGKEAGIFELRDVVGGITKKLIHRHPHVFNETPITYSNEKWEEIKKKEKGYQFHYEAMEAIPKSMPTLYLAEKIQKKAAKVGFEWNNPMLAIDKIMEESLELKESIEQLSKQDIMSEMGDLLFSVVNVARMCHIDPDEALRQTITKFIYRFQFIEENLANESMTPEESDLETMDRLWNLSKE